MRATERCLFGPFSLSIILRNIRSSLLDSYFTPCVLYGYIKLYSIIAPQNLINSPSDPDPKYFLNIVNIVSRIRPYYYDLNHSMLY
jgi:hypothetical protein